MYFFQQIFQEFFIFKWFTKSFLFSNFFFVFTKVNNYFRIFICLFLIIYSPLTFFFIFLIFFFRKISNIILQYFFCLFILFQFFHNTLILQKEYLFFFKYGKFFFIIEDFLSFFFFFLTSIIFLLLFNLIYFYNYKNDNLYFFFFLFLLEFILFFLFTLQSFFFIFLFLEASLVPMFFIIGLWGSKKKSEASFFYMLFSSLSGLLFFLGFSFLNIFFGLNSLQDFYFFFNFIFPHIFLSVFYKTSLFFKIILVLNIIYTFFFFAIAVKAPVFPFHVWLTEAHVEANATGSILLAAVMLKISFYFFLKINFLLTPFLFPALKCFFIIWVSLSIVFCCLSWTRQLDLKRIVAFSSVLHMNFCLICLLNIGPTQLSSVIFYFFGHSLTTSFLFFVVGLLYEHTGSRNFFFYKNLFHLNFIYSFAFFLGCLGNLGFPLSVNFIGEVLVFISILNHSKFICLFLCFSLFVIGVNSFWISSRVLFGRFTFFKKFIKMKTSYSDLFFLFFFLIIVFFYGIKPITLLIFIENLL